MKPDFDVVGVPADEQLKRLATLVQGQIDSEGAVEELTAQLKLATDKLSEFSTDLIPSLMDEIGIESFVLASGDKVSVIRGYAASISEAHHEAALSWLRESGNGSLIKNEVTASFGRGEETRAEELTGLLAKEGVPFKRKEGVHSQTLKAFVKEQMEKGTSIPMDLLGVYPYSTTKIKRSKEAR